MNQTHSTPTMMQLLAVVERGEGDNKKSFWNRIGVAFENRDGSWNLRFDLLPARMSETTIQMRPFDPKRENDEESPGSTPEPAKARTAGPARR
jgi:hypothetical protein